MVMFGLLRVHLWVRFCAVGQPPLVPTVLLLRVCSCLSAPASASETTIQQLEI